MATRSAEAVSEKLVEQASPPVQVIGFAQPRRLCHRLESDSDRAITGWSNECDRLSIGPVPGAARAIQNREAKLKCAPHKRTMFALEKAAGNACHAGFDAVIGQKPNWLRFRSCTPLSRGYSLPSSVHGRCARTGACEDSELRKMSNQTPMAYVLPPRALRRNRMIFSAAVSVVITSLVGWTAALLSHPHPAPLLATVDEVSLPANPGSPHASATLSRASLPMMRR